GAHEGNRGVDPIRELECRRELNRVVGPKVRLPNELGGAREYAWPDLDYVEIREIQTEPCRRGAGEADVDFPSPRSASQRRRDLRRGQPGHRNDPRSAKQGCHSVRPWLTNVSFDQGAGIQKVNHPLSSSSVCETGLPRTDAGSKRAMRLPDASVR